MVVPVDHGLKAVIAVDGARSSCECGAVT